MTENKFAKDTPVYRHDGTYACEHNELPQYRTSNQANIACKEAIEKAIENNYRDNRLNSHAVMEAVRADFSMDRISYVLANTVQFKDWDGRISHVNKEWAKTIPVVPNPDSWGGDRNCYFVVDQVHTGLVDLFVTHFRKELENASGERDVLYAENPIGDDDWFYKRPDSMCFEAVYFNPDSTDGGQYVIMTLPYELISDAAERTNSSEAFFAFLEERASRTELVDITDGNFRAVMDSYKRRPADFIGRSAAVMLSLIKTVAKKG